MLTPQPLERPDELQQAYALKDGDVLPWQAQQPGQNTRVAPLVPVTRQPLHQMIGGTADTLGGRDLLAASGV